MIEEPPLAFHPLYHNTSSLTPACSWYLLALPGHVEHFLIQDSVVSSIVKRTSQPTDVAQWLSFDLWSQFNN